MKHNVGRHAVGLGMVILGPVIPAAGLEAYNAVGSLRAVAEYDAAVGETDAAFWAAAVGSAAISSECVQYVHSNYAPNGVSDGGSEFFGDLTDGIDVTGPCQGSPEEQVAAVNFASRFDEINQSRTGEKESAQRLAGNFSPGSFLERYTLGFAGFVLTKGLLRLVAAAHKRREVDEDGNSVSVTDLLKTA